MRSLLDDLDQMEKPISVLAYVREVHRGCTTDRDEHHTPQPAMHHVHYQMNIEETDDIQDVSIGSSNRLNVSSGNSILHEDTNQGISDLPTEGSIKYDLSSAEECALILVV